MMKQGGTQDASSMSSAPTAARVAALAIKAATNSVGSLEGIAWVLEPEDGEIDTDTLITFLTATEKPMQCVGVPVSSKVIRVQCSPETAPPDLEMHALIARKITDQLRHQYDTDQPLDPTVELIATGDSLEPHVSVIEQFLREYRIQSLVIGIQRDSVWQKDRIIFSSVRTK